MIKPQIDTLTALAKTHFLSLYDACYKNREGKEKHWMIASRKTEEALRQYYFEKGEEKDDAVVLLATHEATEQLVLIKQFRIPLNDFIYELPAGLIDEGEDALSTIGRELKEETGLDLVEILELRPRLYLSAGMTDESVVFVRCTCRGEVSTDYLEADELIDPLLVSKEKARELLASEEKLDIKTYLVLQQFIAGIL
ncbi:MAG: NUDIX hydrolase [Cellulosilyticaceae bacterium]